jgi:G3E family GTPase
VNVGGDGRIPLTIVTGFLGSGKTTLIRTLLSDPAFANAAVIVNEFGAVGIDHHLFFQTDERITLLRDGCACCARRDDLVEALHALIRRRDRGELPSLDAVLLETTGLADPAPILHTVVADPVLGRRYRVERVITTVDAVAGMGNLDVYNEAVRQVTAADALIITKCDLATGSAPDRLAARLSSLNPSADVHVAAHGNVLLSALLQSHDFSARILNHDDNATLIHRSPGGVSSLSLEFAEPLDWRMLGLWLTMLLHCHGERVLRVKGLLDVGEEGPLLLEGVQHVVHAPRHLRQWPTGDHRSRIVLIIRDLDPKQIRASLETFQALARIA